MRTKGSLNKPKFASIRLSDLCEFLQSDSYVPVDIKFARALKEANQNIKFEEIIKEIPAKATPTVSTTKLEFTVQGNE